MCGAIGALTIVQAPQPPRHAFVRILDESRRSSSSDGVRKLHVSPALRHVHVDCALRTPHPVVLRKRFSTSRLVPLHVLSSADLRLPLDAGEIDSPAIAG